MHEETERKRCFSDTFAVASSPTSNSNFHRFATYSKTHQHRDPHVQFYDRGTHHVCHITYWMYVIALMELIALIGSLIAASIIFATDVLPYALINFSIILAAWVVGLVVVACLIMGVRRQRHSLLIPHMLCQIVSIVGMIIAIIIYGVEAGKSHGHYEHDEERDTSREWMDEKTYDYLVAVIVLCTAGLIVQAGFYAQVSKCYRYLKVKKIRRMHSVRRRSSV